MSPAAQAGPVLDAHTHVWRLAVTPQPWIGPEAAPAIARDFSPQDLRDAMAPTAVDAAMLVQSSNDEAETESLLDLAEAHAWVAGVVGWTDLRAPDAAERIDRRSAGPQGRRVCGYRHVFARDEAEAFLGSAEVARALDRLGGLGLAFDLLLSAGELALAVAVARRHPQVTFILDHLAKPSLRRGQLGPWRSELLELGHCPNVCAKLSGLPAEADWATWSPGDLRPYLEAAWDAFGPERLIFATDWPVCTVAGAYDVIVDAQLEFVQGLAPAHQRNVLWDNARRAYRLQPRADGHPDRRPAASTGAPG